MSSKKNLLKISGKLIAVLLLLIFLRSLGVLAPVENFVIKIFKTPLAQLHLSGTSAYQYYEDKIENRKKTSFWREENKELKQKINALSSQNARLKILAQENESLKRELGFLKENDYKTLSARVINNSYYLSDVIIINKGAEDGLLAGLPLVANGGILVGKIIEVKKNTATAILPLSPRARFAANIISEEQNVSGVTRGEHNLSLRMDLIPKNSSFSKNDLVVTSGLEENIPPGLIIGKVIEIIDISGSLFQEAIISPGIIYGDVKFVSIILS